MLKNELSFASGTVHDGLDNFIFFNFVVVPVNFAIGQPLF
jgi:hypothetical protein